MSPFPVTYISFPSAKDPTWENKHPNRSTLQIISLANSNWFKNWENSSWRKREPGYLEIKDSISDRLLNQLYSAFPVFKGKVDHFELSTPLSTKHFSNYDQGEIYGLEHTPAQYLDPRLTPHTPIQGLYLSGQDIASNGVAGALVGGMLAAGSASKMRWVSHLLKPKSRTSIQPSSYADC